MEASQSPEQRELSQVEILAKCVDKESLSWEEYKFGAEQTLNGGSFYGGQYPIEVALKVIKNFLQATKLLDELKKSLFYGKSTLETAHRHQASLGMMESYELKPWHPQIDLRLLHAFSGIATESAELLEAWVTSVQSLENPEEFKPLDFVNLSEELGDLLWYVAISNIHFHTATRLNLLKLYVRYGYKFSEAKAISRDLDTERTILEQT